MSFIKSNIDFTDCILTLDNLEKKLNISINRTKKLVLIFSLTVCQPCKQLTNSIDEIYNDKNIDKSLLPLIIKFNVDDDLLNDDDIKYIKKYPTIFIFDQNDMINYNDEESLIDSCYQNSISNNNQKGTIIVGNLNKFLDQTNLSIDF